MFLIKFALQRSRINVNDFLDTLMSDPGPQCLLWLPIVHRMAQVENGLQQLNHDLNHRLCRYHTKQYGVYFHYNQYKIIRRTWLKHILGRASPVQSANVSPRPTHFQFIRCVSAAVLLLQSMYTLYTWFQHLWKKKFPAVPVTAF